MTRAPRFVFVLTIVLGSALSWACMPALAAQTVAANPRGTDTVDDISAQVMCPTCGTTVDRSNSEVARRMRAFIKAELAQGATREEIIADLVREYGGEDIRAGTPTDSAGTAVWAVPLVIAALILVSGMLIVRRRGARSAKGATTA